MKLHTLKVFFSIGFLLSAFAVGAESPQPEIFVEPSLEATVQEAPSRVWTALEINVTPVNYPSYEWMPGSFNQKNGTALHVAFEFIPLDTIVGKFGLGLASGMGWLTNVSLGADTAANLYVVPVETYLGYRLDVIDNQVVVPFAKIGPNYTLVRQIRNQGDEQQDIWGGFYGMSYSLGGELLLNLIDRGAAGSMRRNFGVKGTYLTFEYRKTRLFYGENTSNLSGEEYRLGLRFEI